MFKALVAQGENEAVEFKTATVCPESLASEMVAFANTSGGHILLGVGDCGEPEGLPEDKPYEEWVVNIARQNVTPALEVQIQKVQVADENVLMVKVPKGKGKPYQNQQQRFLVRVGSTNRTATQQELLRLFQQSGAFHFDANAVENTSIKSLKLFALDSYFNRYDVDFQNDDDKEQLLKQADVLSESGEATVAGLMVFGINPQKSLPSASMSFARFSGLEIEGDLLDKQVIEGDLPQQIDNMLRVIKSHTQEPSRIEGAKAVSTVKHYPDKVFRELLVNAAVHRNYSISGSRIRILMFADRLEVISPGNMHNSVTIEKLPVGVSYAPNPVLLKFMENLRNVDKLGRGLPMVCQEAKRLGVKVDFEEVGVEFKVTLPLVRSTTEQKTTDDSMASLGKSNNS